MRYQEPGSARSMIWTLLSLAISLTIVFGLVALALIIISLIVLGALAVMAALSAREPRRSAASSPG
ncbi:hypothetical protein GCM10020219_051720 [Nonomuraea dietziae]